MIEGVLERLPATVRRWSDGLATLDPLDVIEVRRPIRPSRRAAAAAGGSGRARSATELEEYAAPDRYDSVYALWPCDPGVPQCGWGCTLGPAEATFGAGFSSISTDHWPTLATDPDPPQGYVHEWLHQVESVYRELGLGRRRAARPARRRRLHLDARPAREPPFGRSYAEYHDGNGGRRRRADLVAVVSRLDDRPAASRRRDEPTGRRPIGLTPERWALRRLIAGAASDAPGVSPCAATPGGAGGPASGGTASSPRSRRRPAWSTPCAAAGAGVRIGHRRDHASRSASWPTRRYRAASSGAGAEPRPRRAPR